MERKKHPDIGRTVLYNGMRCKVIGASYSHRYFIGETDYHLIPEGRFSLKNIIQYVPVSLMAFDPPRAVTKTIGVDA